jgi:thiamine-phosphate pyrophosphorylase
MPSPHQVRGLYPLLSDDVVDLAQFQTLAAAVAPVVSVLQLRWKQSDDAAALDSARRSIEALGAWPGLLVINDRPDIAAILARETTLHLGLHLGQDDLPPTLARAIVGPDVVIGYSTHDLDQVREAATLPVDYLGFGPVFPTSTKLNPDPTVGLDGLAAAIAATHLPIVAIGGLDAPRAKACLEAGAQAVAVVSALFAGPAERLGTRLDTLRRALNFA